MLSSDPYPNSMQIQGGPFNLACVFYKVTITDPTTCLFTSKQKLAGIESSQTSVNKTLVKCSHRDRLCVAKPKSWKG